LERLACRPSRWRQPQPYSDIRIKVIEGKVQGQAEEESFAAKEHKDRIGVSVFLAFFRGDFPL
jgi:hypothetical protein